MRPTRTATLTALAAALSTLTGLTLAAPSHAGVRAVGAGDEIAVHSAAGSTTCTLGYTYTAGETTYGVTAGHCTRGGGSAVSDYDSGATGRVAVGRVLRRQAVGRQWSPDLLVPAPASR